MPVYALTIFTGAFLLFLVQPLIGKYILPWFGGAPAVWTTCMLFFQLLLLAGYAYAHCSARWLKPRAQALVHLALLVAAMALLGHITPADSWKPTDGANPTLRILGLLLASIGLPYFVLASTSPLMQHWFSRTNPGASPFRLYALSNIGSMLALLSFPVYFETHFTRPVQAHLWAAGLVLFAVSCGACAWKLWQTPEKFESVSTKAGSPADVAPALLQKILWLLLPACASVLLLATTNMICQEVAVIPFLWVLPLALYLLTFIICFDSPRWYVRLPFAVMLVAALGGICWLVIVGTEASMYVQLGGYLAGLFICCMVCHGELYRLRPDPRQLTGFYLMISAGGALGGLFVAVVAPFLFNDYYELHWGLFLCGLLFLVICLRERNVPVPKQKLKSRFQFSQPLINAACLILAAGLVALGIALGLAKQLQAHLNQSTPLDPFQKSKAYSKMLVEQTRNFYGVLTVFQHDDAQWNTHHLELSHGRTVHGMQFTDPERSRWPMVYYDEGSGVGLAMNQLPPGNRRIGSIGLGTGTLATYPQTGDYMHIYEINPEVLRIARSRFTYLANCRGTVEVTLGDARLSLEKEPPQNFDLLVLDAFNSDAIPVHLLTREAFTIYQRHLKADGVIAVHISNKNLNLEPVLANVARNFGYRVTTIDQLPPKDKPWVMGSVWVLLSHNEAIMDTPAIRLAGRPTSNQPNVPLWTDDFASLFQILRSEAPQQVDPAITDEHCRLAFTLCGQGDFAGAIKQYRSGLKTLPRAPILLSNLGFLLANCPDVALRDLPEATRLAEAACRLTHYYNPDFLTTLGAIYSETGRFTDAIQMTEKSTAIATETGEKVLVQKNEELLKFYRANRPYHESVGQP